MRKSIGYIGGMALTAMLWAGCGSTRPAGGARVTPETQQLTADVETGEAMVRATFEVPADYLTKRSRLVIVPRLWMNDSLLAEFTPMVLEGAIYRRKMERRKELEGYVDPYAMLAQPAQKGGDSYTLPFEERVSLPEGAGQASLMAVLSMEGCEPCAAIDTVQVASLTRPERPRFVIRWMDPEFTIHPKVVEGSGEAQLRFLINRHEINPSLGKNELELKRLSDTLATVFKDTLATVNHLTITGMASADGSQAYNLKLAHDRAEAACDWLVEALDIDLERKGLIAIDARPEGWEPVLRAMEADGHPGSEQVRAILRKWPVEEEDCQEQAIRALSCWQEIRQRYLDSDRRVAYSYAYTIRSFTTEQELRMAWQERPDALSEAEWLRLAALMESDADRERVYESMTRFFPQAEVAYNNLAVICLRTQREKEARAWLCRVPRWCNDLEGKVLRLEE